MLPSQPQYPPCIGIVVQGAVKDRESAAVYGTEKEQSLYHQIEID